MPEKAREVNLNEKHREEIEDFLGKVATLPLRWRIHNNQHIRSRGIHDCPLSASTRHEMQREGLKVNVSVNCVLNERVYTKLGLTKLTANILVAAADGNEESRYYIPWVRDKLLAVTQAT